MTKFISAALALPENAFLPPTSTRLLSGKYVHLLPSTLSEIPRPKFSSHHPNRAPIKPTTLSILVCIVAVYAVCTFHPNRPVRVWRWVETGNYRRKKGKRETRTNPKWIRSRCGWKKSEWVALETGHWLKTNVTCLESSIKNALRLLHREPKCFFLSLRSIFFSGHFFPIFSFAHIERTPNYIERYVMWQ